MSEGLADIFHDVGDLLLESYSSIDQKEDVFSSVHAMLMQRLHGLTRHCPVISAENYMSFQGRLPARYWLLKPPLETEKNPIIQAALIRGGVSVRSAIYFPATELLYTAEKNAGAFCGNTRLHVNTDRRIGEYIVVGKDSSPSHVLLERFAEWKCGGYMNQDSLAEQVCALASGLADILYYESPIDDWDIAAGMLLVREAGGCVTSIDGSPYVLGDTFRRCDIMMCANENIRDRCARRRPIPPVRPAFRRFIREMAVMSATRRRKKHRVS